MISATQASRRRKQWKEGKPLTESQHEELLEYERAHPKGSQEYTQANAEHEPGEDGDAIPPPPVEVLTGELPPLPPPPGAEPGKGKAPPPGGEGKKKKKWQRRKASAWRKKFKGAEMDREQFCVGIAAAYCALLKKVGDATEELGGISLNKTIQLSANDAPINIVDHIVFPAAIAVCDTWLPDLTAAPEMVVAGTGAFQLGAYLKAKRDATVDVEETGGSDLGPDPREDSEQ